MDQPAYRDRCKNYVPTDLHLPAPWTVELGERPEHRRFVQASWGAADELNRERQGHWNWADVSKDQDGSHWSRFDGHHEQVDISVTTYNSRETNDWKGRDEIRGRAQWTVSIDRVQVGEGWTRTWEQAHRAAAEYVRKLQNDGPLSGLMDSWRDAEEKLVGRPVWYREQPAVIQSLILDQGCMIVRPTMAEKFTPEPHYGSDISIDTSEYDTAKVELLSPHIWWWRDADNDLFPYQPREDAYA